MRKLLTLLAMLFSALAFAQNREIRGQVVEKSSGQILIGAVVNEKGTKKSVITDASGNFKIQVDAKEIILASKFIGFKDQEIKVAKDQNNVVFKLEEDQVQLNQVVAVGYGTVRRQDLVGAVSSVTAKDLKDIPVNSVAQALAGRVAGLEVTASDGSPDAQVKLAIRGGNSITQDNSPLYIIDGVQVETGLAGLSPHEIESIDVLKDAASTSIYGARGANGVIIVSTKSGKEGTTSVVYNGMLGTGHLAKELEVLDPFEFVMTQYERAVPNATTLESFVNRYGLVADLASYKDKPFKNWQQALFGRDALMYNNNVRVSGGSKATQFSAIYANSKQEGIAYNSGLTRNTLNVKLDHTANKKFKLGVTMRYNKDIIDASGIPAEGNTMYYMLRHAIKYTPYLTAADEEDFIDEDYYELTSGNTLGILNPILLTNGQYRKNYAKTLNLGGYVGYTFNKYFSFRSTIGANATDSRRDSFDDFYTPKARVNGSLPMAGVGNGRQNSFNNSNVISYTNPKIAKSQSLNVIVGQELYGTNLYTDAIQMKDFLVGVTPEKALNQFSLGTVLPGSAVTTASASRLFSFFARANYDYGRKFLVTASVRTDGSSKFSPENRWGVFPSGSVAWRISREKFMRNVRQVTDLKLRFSYGLAGNNRIGDFLYGENFESTGIRYGLNEVLTPGLAATSLANPNLKWETTVSRNLGLDLDLYKGKLQITVDAYLNNTKDLLVRSLVPSSSGYVNQLLNIGETQNKGLEVQIGANVINKKDFTWKIDFNTGFNRNTVKKLHSGQNSELFKSGIGFSANQPADFIVKVGQPVGTMYGWVNDGLYTTDDFTWAGNVPTLKPGVVNSASALGTAVAPGVAKFKDLDGDGDADANDRTIIGNPTPKFTGGMNNQFRFKGFDLSVFVNFKYGNDIFNANKIEFTSGMTKNTNMISIMKNRWRNVDENFQHVTDPVKLAEINKNATMWTPIGTSVFHPMSWAIEDGSFLRLNNVTLGYTLPSKLLEKAKIKALRVYATLNNIAIWTKYSGYDPEVDVLRSTPLTPGVDYSAYPRSKTYLFGLNLTL